MRVFEFETELEKNEEIWKDIEGYEGLYQVSNLGRVKSLNRKVKFSPGEKQEYYQRKPERYLSPNKKENGYFEHSLYKEGKRKHMYAHRLVALHFIPNPDDLPQVNHKDENKSNNRVSNLEWITAQENSIYGSKIDRQVKNTDYKKMVANNDYEERSKKYFNKKIIGEKGNMRIVFYSVTFASKFINCSVSQISSVLVGRKNTCRGWTFSYAK